MALHPPIIASEMASKISEYLPKQNKTLGENGNITVDVTAY